MLSVRGVLIVGALVVASALCAAALTAGILRASTPAPATPFETVEIPFPDAPVPPLDDLPVTPVVSPGKIEKMAVRVSVTGAVVAPDMLELNAGDRIHHLIQKAGGTTDDADLRDINLAAPLIDGSTLTIPSLPRNSRGNRSLVMRGGAGAPTFNPASYTRSGWHPDRRQDPMTATPADSGAGTTASTSPSDTLIDLNTATQAQLETLPGVGPVTARKILDYRSGNMFRSVRDLMSVPGIGPKKLEAVQHLVTVR